MKFFQNNVECPKCRHKFDYEVITHSLGDFDDPGPPTKEDIPNYKGIKKKMSEDKDGYDLAEEHWEYVESVCRKMFIDGFLHGYKHGLEEREK